MLLRPSNRVMFSALSRNVAVVFQKIKCLSIMDLIQIVVVPLAQLFDMLTAMVGFMDDFLAREKGISESFLSHMNINSEQWTIIACPPWVKSRWITINFVSCNLCFLQLTYSTWQPKCEGPKVRFFLKKARSRRLLSVSCVFLPILWRLAAVLPLNILHDHRLTVP